MQCKNCGGTLIYKDGMYICSSCGSQHNIGNSYEDIDAYICYVEADEAGRRTKDSILAQDIYQTLERSKIKTFYARISAPRLTGGDLEKACNDAIYSAKTVVLLGTCKQHFDELVEKYSALYAGKTIIPVFADMDAYDIPKGISAIQALDYTKVGASIDLTKSILNVLGREQEVDYNLLTEKDSDRKSLVIWIASTVFVIVLLALGAYFLIFRQDDSTEDISQSSSETTQISSEISETSLSEEEIRENKYSEAMEAVESVDYVRAVELFQNLTGYKDSDKQLNLIYQKYAGYYQNEDERITFRLQVWEGNAAAIELSQVTPKGYCRISESFQLQGTQINLEFNDSESNKGSLVLELENGTLTVQVDTTSVASDIYIQNTKVSFSMDEKSDKPFGVSIDAETIRGWITTKTTVRQLQQFGYEIETAETGVLKIKYTEILFITATTNLITHETSAEPYICAISAPASVIIPDKIGMINDAFEENNILYVPSAKVGRGGEGWQYSLDPRKIIPENISANTPVAIVSKAISQDYKADVETYLKQNITKSVYPFYMQKYDCEKDEEDCIAFIVAENSDNYLVACEVKYREYPIAYYKVNKDSRQVDFIEEFPYEINIGSHEVNLDPEDLYKDYPDLFNEFMSPSEILAAQPKVFSKGGMSITLTNAFKELENQNYISYYSSDKVDVFVSKENRIFFDDFENYTSKQYVVDLLQYNGLDSYLSTIENIDGLTCFEYSSTYTYSYSCFVYKTNDAFWLVEFSTPYLSKKYFPKIVEWAKTVSFE